MKRSIDQYKAVDLNVAITELEAEVDRLTKENKIRKSAMDNWVPCQACRGKIPPGKCQLCRAETAEAALAKITAERDEIASLLASYEILHASISTDKLKATHDRATRINAVVGKAKVLIENRETPEWHMYLDALDAAVTALTGEDE